MVASPPPFPIILPVIPGCRGRTDEGARITVPLESFHEVVLLFLQVLSLLVVKTLPYRTPFHMCWMVRPKVQVSVCICLQYTVISSLPSGLHVILVSRKGRDLMLFRWCKSPSTSPFLKMQHVSSTYRFHNLGLEGADSRASSSKNSLTGEPIVAPVHRIHHLSWR